MPWTPISVSGVFSPLMNAPGQHGHMFTVAIQLQHTPSDDPTAPFEEPKLEWNEEITSVDLRRGTFFEWHGDLYGYRPNAFTFTAWRHRYDEAYDHARGHPVYVPYGSSVLTTMDWQPVTLAQIHGVGPGTTIQPLTDPQQKADAVRRFISSTRCLLTVSIIDRPSLGIGDGQSARERVLVFQCGVGAHTVHAYQHLRVNGNTLTPPLPNIHAHGRGGPPPGLLATVGMMPDVARTLDHEYSNFETSADALSLTRELGRGEYR